MREQIQSPANLESEPGVQGRRNRGETGQRLRTTDGVPRRRFGGERVKPRGAEPDLDEIAHGGVKIEARKSSSPTTTRENGDLPLPFRIYEGCKVPLSSFFAGKLVGELLLTRRSICCNQLLFRSLFFNKNYQKTPGNDIYLFAPRQTEDRTYTLLCMAPKRRRSNFAIS